jgi:hypothetical protein
VNVFPVKTSDQTMVCLQDPHNVSKKTLFLPPALYFIVSRLDPEGFYRSIMKDQDRRRICGFPAIYTMLNVMEVRKGKLLKYGQAFTPETQSVVSFASLAFYG